MFSFNSKQSLKSSFTFIMCWNGRIIFKKVFKYWIIKEPTEPKLCFRKDKNSIMMAVSSFSQILLVQFLIFHRHIWKEIWPEGRVWRIQVISWEFLKLSKCTLISVSNVSFKHVPLLLLSEQSARIGNMRWKFDSAVYIMTWSTVSRSVVLKIVQRAEQWFLDCLMSGQGKEI